MDPTTRRLTAAGLAVAVVATIYTVNSGDWIKAALSLASVAVCLFWGFWPDLRRKRGHPGAGGVSFEVAVEKAGYLQQTISGQRVSVLRLRLLVEVNNDTDAAVTVRPTDLELVRPARWRRLKPLAVRFEPEALIGPGGKVASFSHFPEGQYLIAARSEGSGYFFFKAIADDAGDDFLDRSLKLRVTIRVPGPHRVTIPLPPVMYV